MKMQKLKGLISFIVLLLAFGFLTTNNVSAASPWDQNDVPVNKVWTITFNKEVEESTINNENIYVSDSNGVKLRQEVKINNDRVSAKVFAPIQGYEAGKTYTMTIKKDVKAKDGKSLNQQTGMAFTTKIDQINVVFEDENLKRAIHLILLKPLNEPLTINEAKSITKLDLDSKGITSIQGLENFTNLIELKMHSNKIADLTPISGLKNLKYIGLNGNKVIDISPLSNLTALENLNLGRNEIVDIGPLRTLTNLKILRLEWNNIENLDVLARFEKLTYLYISYNEFSDITSLRYLHNLKDLLSDSLNLDLNDFETQLTINILAKKGTVIPQEWRKYVH